MVAHATGVPVITPLVVFKVPPVELFNNPKATEDIPVVLIKLLLPKTTEFIPQATLQYPTAVLVAPALVLPNPTASEATAVDPVKLLNPKAEEEFPIVALQIPTEVESLPIVVDVATGVPVITPVVVSKVPPVELFRRPIATEAKPPAPEKLLRPKIDELRAEAVLAFPTATELKAFTHASA